MRSGALNLCLTAAVACMLVIPQAAMSAPVSTGTVIFDNSDTPWAYFLAILDYEAYAPGDVDNPVDAGAYPGVNTEYTFVYTLRDSSISVVPLDGIDIQLAAGATITATGSIDDGSPATIPPDGPAIVTATLASFDFFGGGAFPLRPGVSSEQFFMITPYPPGDAVVTVVFDGTSEDEINVACPVLPSSICGNVGASCHGDPPAPAAGITIDIYDIDGALIATTDTDVAGDFCFDWLVPGDYLVTIVTPLSYGADIEEIWVTAPGGDPISQNFALTCKDIVAEPRTIGFWKHQVGVAAGGKGNAQIDAATLCGYLDLIEARFNNNAMNPVAIYQPPASGLCADKLLVARDILKLKGKVPMEWRAKQQLLALLFNVAAAKISLAEVISEDGANVSQAITFCDNEIDDPNGNRELAKSIADEINNGRVVPAGWIPLGTDVIYYTRRRIEMINAFPTVFAGSTNISFTIRGGGFVPVDLKVFDVTGRLLKTITKGDFGPGTHTVVWDGSSDHGARVASGVYLYRIEARGEVASGKLIVRH